jgi:hypothetical protein
MKFFLTFMLVCLISEARAQAPRNLCQEIATELRDLRPPPFAGRQRLFEYQQRAGIAYQAIAYKIFNNYLARNIKPKEYIECFHLNNMSAHVERLETLLPGAFFYGTIRRLKLSPSATVRLFATDVERLLDSGSIMFLGISVPSDSNNGTALNFGGFHRGQNGLYINPNELPSNQWYLIFFHEFAHALDDSLRNAVEKEAESPLIPYLEKMSKKEVWDNSDEEEVRAQILISFDRGFTAEFRAWIVAASLYYQTEKLPSVEWFERILQFAPHFNLASDKTIYLFLSPRFVTEPTGVFSDYRIYDIVTNIRQGWDEVLPQLGPLKKYITYHN